MRGMAMGERLGESSGKITGTRVLREDLLRIGLKIGTQEGLGFELCPWVTDQHPAGEAGHGGHKPVEYHTAV
jgi:hypothetical protein